MNFLYPENERFLTDLNKQLFNEEEILDNLLKHNDFTITRLSYSSIISLIIGILLYVLFR
jgi:hypothetical protein